jgi:PilZ domain
MKIMDAENRSYPRRDIDHVVKIKIPIRGSLIDISRSGARISIDNPADLPDEFMLDIRDDLSRWCRVIWRGDNEVGVEYIETPESCRLG